MDFSLTRVGDENLHLFDSGVDCQVQLVFVSGVFSLEAWKYQLNYFSEDYRTVAFKPTVSNKDFEGHRNALKQIINQEEMDNIVLIGANYSNSLVQSFEAHEDVVGTVLIGAKKKMKKEVPREVYEGLTSKFFPCKLAKKFFLPSMRYSDVKNFCDKVDFLEFEDFEGFRKRFGVRKPEKECMIVHGSKDFFSCRSYARSLMSCASVTEVEAGVFSFYEKPQEFNKMLHDFLVRLERKALKESIEDSREKNRALTDFEERKLKVNK